MSQKIRPRLLTLPRMMRLYLLSGMVTISFSELAKAAEDSSTKPADADFDPAFLVGEAKKVDINRFRHGNPVLPGEYNVDVYINGVWYGRRRMTFNSQSNQQDAVTCFNPVTLLEYGVKEDFIHTAQPMNKSPCGLIGDYVDQAFYEFDIARLRMDISIPQVAMRKNAQGYVDPAVWDHGINAGFLSYSASVYKTVSEAERRQENNNAFASINAGLNLASWQLRHFGQWTWQDHKQDKNSGSDYQAVSTYAQRAFPKYYGVLTLGDSFTNGELFDSIGYRGVDFSSDDRMLPNSMLGYAPRIRGVAKTAAKVEVRQQGQLIYQTSVSPGDFEINDLYPTGFGGELEVSVIETNGEIQRFAVPYSSVVQMLRPGMSRYAVTAGQFRDVGINATPWLLQGKYQRGLNNYLTGYTGFQWSDHYFSALAGLGVSTPIGAVALDITHSSADFERQSSRQGQSYRLSYSKLISATNTNLTLAAYRYSTEGYYKFRDAALVRDLEQQGQSTLGVGRQRSEFQITLNQTLPPKWGNFYAIGSWADYWNTSSRHKQYQLGYSNNYHGLTYGFSTVKSRVEQRGSSNSVDDTKYLLTFSFPLDFEKNSANVNWTETRDSQNIGVSGVINDRLSYGASMSKQTDDNANFNVNGRYRTNYTTLGGSYSYSKHYKQSMLNASGSVVAHAGGVLFGPEQGQTMALVYAPDAAGAKVNNTVGLSVNKAGYAVIPYVTPYRLNDVTLDPQDMSSNVELEQTSQRIAPYAGAITKVDFSTKTGQAMLIASHRPDGSLLPFSAQVYDAHDQSVGMVAQGSQVYVRTQEPQGKLLVKWGESASEQCHISYDINQLLKGANNGMIMLEEVCQ